MRIGWPGRDLDEDDRAAVGVGDPALVEPHGSRRGSRVTVTPRARSSSTASGSERTCSQRRVVARWSTARGLRQLEVAVAQEEHHPAGELARDRQPERVGVEGPRDLPVARPHEDAAREHLHQSVLFTDRHGWPAGRASRGERPRARSPPLAGPRGLPRRRVHDAARRQHRQRRPPADPAGARRVGRASCVGGVGLRADLRAGARLGRAASATTAAGATVFLVGLGAVHADQRAGRRRADRRRWLVVARLLQGAAGGMLDPQVIGFIQQLFRGRRARAGLRPVRRRDRRVHRRRAAAGRAAARVGRRGRRLALGVLRQRADRGRRPAARLAAAARRRVRRGPRSRARSTRRRAAAGRGGGRPDAAAGRPGAAAGAAPVVAARCLGRAARGASSLWERRPRAATATRWSTSRCCAPAATRWARRWGCSTSRASPRSSSSSRCSCSRAGTTPRSRRAWR